MHESVLKLKNLLYEHREYRVKNSINLIPSENILSPEVRAILASDLAGRYTSEEKFYKGTKFIDEIEDFGKQIARSLFNVKYVDLRMISGHIADITFLVTYSKKGDILVCLSPEHGGYPGISKEALPKILGLNVEYFPFDLGKMKIKVSESIDLIQKIKPKVIILGSSLILYPHPVKEISNVAKEVGSVLGYDGSHVLGLIAGNQFQDPIREGAIALFGSTHKTFFGPQGGIFLSDSNDDFIYNIHPSIVDNAHYNRIAALAMALLEMKEFGKDYAKQIVNNAQTLGKALLEFGLPVKSDKNKITESHQVLLTPNPYHQNSEFAKELESVNIITDSGIRLGVNEVTRWGMKENEMQRIAEFIYKVYKREDKSRIKEEVIKLKNDFETIEYRFKDIDPFEFIQSFF